MQLILDGRAEMGQMNTREVIVECETCRNWGWSGRIPAYVNGEWHHPAHAVELETIAASAMVRLPSGALVPLRR